MDDEFEEVESNFDDHHLGHRDLENRIEDLENSRGWGNNAAVSGFGLGSLIAGILSWDKSHALGWLVIHSLLSWFYVIYRVIVDWRALRLF